MLNKSLSLKQVATASGIFHSKVFQLYRKHCLILLKPARDHPLNLFLLQLGILSIFIGLEKVNAMIKMVRNFCETFLRSIPL